MAKQIFRGSRAIFWPTSSSTLDAVRREEAVEKRVATVFQGFKGCLLGEVVNVPVQFPTFQKPSFAQHGLYAQIQRNMKYLQLALWSDCGQEAEIVFDVLENIEDQHQVEEDAFLLTDVPQFELESFVRSAPAHLQGLRRDVVSPESACVVHLLVQELEHFACATTDVADGLRPQPVLLHHPQDLVDLERGFIDVPARIVLQVFPVDVDISVEHAARDSRWTLSLLVRSSGRFTSSSRVPVCELTDQAAEPRWHLLDRPAQHLRRAASRFLGACPESVEYDSVISVVPHPRLNDRRPSFPGSVRPKSNV